MSTPATPTSNDGKVFHVGTLTYTKAGLFALFGWILWGDFCLVLMETAAPAVLQVNLNEMGAPNWVIGLVLSTIPGVLNMTICPASSFWSDRFRSRWGRRIPFLFVATIPLTLFLVLLGFSKQIGTLLHGAINGGFSQTVVILAVVVVLVFCFQVFNMVITSVYYYLFNDVVPAEVLARFMSIFRIVGVLAGAVFNWFFLKYAVSHMTEVYLIAAGLYATAFLLMCWKVKEGEYPPPPAHPDGGSGLVRVGQLMNESHESSRTLFENSCEELDFLAAEARTIPGCLGARLTGGGFGGAVLALVKHGTEDDFVEAISERTDRAWGRVPQTLVTGAGGA